MTNRDLEKFLEDTSNLEMRLNRAGGELLLAGKSCFGVFEKENIYFFENEAKEIEIWNATQDRIHKISKITRPTGSRVTAMTTSGEFNMFAAAFEGNSIEIWAFQTEYKLFEQISTIGKSDQDWISALAITKSSINKKDIDGQFLASGSRDGTIAVWDLKNGELYHKFEYAHIGMIWSLLFSHSNLLISGASDRAIQIWDMEKKKLSKRIQDAHEGDVTSLTLSGEDKFVISGSLDKSIAIWDLRQLLSSEDGSTKKTESESLSGRITDAHSSGVSCVAVTTVCDYIISGSFDRSVKIWSNHQNGSRTCTSQMLFDTAVTSLGMSREQNIIFAGSQNRTVKIWERSKEKEHLTFDHAANSTGALKFAKDQGFFITKACGNFVTIVQIGDLLLTERIDLSDFGYSDVAGEDIDITSDGKLLIIPNLTGKSITVLDLQEKKVSHHFESTHSDTILWIRVSPDNEYFISYSKDRSLAVWDFRNRKLHHRWEDAHNGSRLISAVISEKKNHLFTGDENNSIVVWDFHQREQLHVFDHAHGNPNSHRVLGLAITKDGLYLASSGLCEIVIWDLSANTKCNTFPKEKSSSKSLAFSSDMKLLAFWNADWSASLRIQDFEAGTLGGVTTIIQDLHPPFAEIDSLCFIPGTCLLISSAQGEISICDTKKEIFIDRLNTKQVQSPSLMIPFGDASSDQILYVQGNKVLSLDIRTKKKSIIFDNVNHVPITALAASNDRSMIAFNCWKSIIVVNVETKAKSFQIDELHYRKPAPFLVFTNDAQHLISCGPLCYEGPPFIVVCCLKTGQVLFKIRGDGPVKAVPGSKKLVSLSGVLSIDGNFSHRFPTRVHTGWVYCSALSEDGRIWVTGGADLTIAVWDLKTMSLMKRIVDPRITQNFGSIFITRDGKYVFANSGGSIALYDLQTLTLVFVKKVEDTGVSMVSTDRYVVTSSHYGLFSIWDTQSRNELTSIMQSPSPVAPQSVAGLSPDGRYLILSHAEGYEVLYSQTNNKDHVPLYSISAKPPIGATVWITQENEMIFRSFSTLSFKPQLTFWDLEDRREIKAYEQKDRPVSWQVSCDGKYLVASFVDLTISVWNLRDTKIGVQIANAHKTMGRDGNFPLNLTSNSRYIISGAGDNTIAVWALGEESHSPLVHRFENAHVSTITALTSTKDSKFLVSCSYDSIVAIWNLEDSCLTHRFINIESHVVWWVKLTSDDRFIMASYQNEKIAIFDFRNLTLITKFKIFEDTCSSEYHQESSTLLLADREKRLLVRRSTRALIPDSITFLPPVQVALQKCRSSDSTTKQELVDETDISILSGIYLMKKRWNFLNLVIFLLPNVSPHTLLHLAIKNKVYLSLDYQNKTQLDYLLDYKGQKTVEVHQFSAYFFKKLSSFINLKGLYKDELLVHLSQLTQQISETQSQSSFLRFFNNFVFDPTDILNNYSKLPIQGTILNEETKAYITLPEFSIKTDEYKSVVSPEGTTTLKFHLLAFPLSCDITADDTLMMLQVFNSYEVEDTQFFDSLVIQDLLDFYWKISKKVLWLNVCFFTISAVLFTLFAIIYPNPGNTEAINILLILSDVLNCAVLIFEFAQASASIKDFIHDPWNFIEVTTATLPIVSSILYWANGPAQVLSFFTALSIMFLYTKILITLRVIDQLRQLIRMILEILTDSMSFMIVVLVYTLAFTLLIYQIRLVDGEGPDFPSVLLEIYTLVIGSWDDTLYPGIAMPFFLVATFLCTLVLLNMLIALMGSTYGRVMDNHIAYDNRERIAMMYEICSISNELRKVFRFCLCRRKIDKEAERNTSFLLVVREFEPIDVDDEPTLQSTTEKLSKKMETEIRSIHDQMKNEVESMMNQIRTEFNSLRNVIAQMQTEVIKDKVHSSI